MELRGEKGLTKAAMTPKELVRPSLHDLGLESPKPDKPGPGHNSSQAVPPGTEKLLEATSLSLTDLYAATKEACAACEFRIDGTEDQYLPHILWGLYLNLRPLHDAAALSAFREKYRIKPVGQQSVPLRDVVKHFLPKKASTTITKRAEVLERWFVIDGSTDREKFFGWFAATGVEKACKEYRDATKTITDKNAALFERQERIARFVAGLPPEPERTAGYGVGRALAVINIHADGTHEVEVVVHINQDKINTTLDDFARKKTPTKKNAASLTPKVGDGLIGKTVPPTPKSDVVANNTDERTRLDAKSLYAALLAVGNDLRKIDPAQLDVDAPMTVKADEAAA